MTTMAKKKPALTMSTMEWADARANDPAHRDAIAALMTELDLEQDLAALREERGLTQVQLAGRAGVSQGTISKLESGKMKNLELRTIVQIAAALGARVKIAFEKWPTAKRRRRVA
jgi:DNA-binding XRE family transcriptional regulator